MKTRRTRPFCEVGKERKNKEEANLASKEGKKAEEKEQRRARTALSGKS